MLCNWFVLTGGPCSGKTSTIIELQKLGYSVAQEAARQHMSAELARGIPIEKVRADPIGLQLKILAVQSDTERKLERKSLTFLDSGVFDPIAYTKVLGGDSAPLIARYSGMRYRRAFMLDLLPMKQDAIRTESFQDARRIRSALIEIYRAMKIPITRVPKMPSYERARFIVARSI